MDNITINLPATTATRRDPATAQQAMQAYGTAQISNLIDKANAYALAKAQAAALAAVSVELIVGK